MIIRPWRSPAASYVATAPRSGGTGVGAGVVEGGDGAEGPGGGASDPSPRGGAADPSPRPRVALPPDRMPFQLGGRPLKRWCYVGVFGPDVMLCAGNAQVGPVPQAFWAVWDRQAGVLETETTLAATGRVAAGPGAVRVRSGRSRLELAISPTGEPVEVVSPHGRSYIWTRKTPVRADGHLTLGMEARPVSAFGILDESAGYHARHTQWEWSAGVGTTVDGWPVTWNLVRGVHDAETMSERTVWVRGRAVEAPPVRFSGDLDEVWGVDGSVLRFREEATRRRRENLGLVRSDYVQPFGRFEGTLPGGLELSRQAPAFGVMERHSARW